MGKAISQTAPSIFVGLLCCLITFLFLHSSGNMMGVDGFYHAAHGQSYFTETTIGYPKISYFSEYPADPWLLYHWLIGVTDYLIPGGDGNDLITATLVAHSVLSGLLIFVLLEVARTFAGVYTPTFKRSNALIEKYWWIVAIFVGLAAYFLFAHFGYRMFLLQRPHTGMVLLSLVALLGLFQQRFSLIFGASLLAPLSYSMSLFVFLPQLILSTGWLISDRTRQGFRTVTKAILVGGSAWMFGVLLHPDSLGYLVNGVGFHTFAILQSLFPALFAIEIHAIPDEMRAASIKNLIRFPTPLLWATGVAVFSYVLASQIPKKQSVSFEKTLVSGLQAITVFSLLASVFIYRAGEYAYPLLIIWLTSFVCIFGWPLFCGVVTRISNTLHPHDSKEKVRMFTYALQAIILLGGTIITLFNSSLIATQFNQIVAGYKHEPDRYAGAADYLTNSSSTGLVVLSRHDYYAQLVFYGDFRCESETSCEISIASGMDARKAHFYDPEFAHTQDRLFGRSSKDTFTQAELEQMQETLLSYGVIYVLVDEENLDVQQLLPDMQHYDFFTKVYSDPKYPSIHLYEITPQDKSQTRFKFL